MLGGSFGDEAKRSSRDLRAALDDATGATAFVGAILGIVGGAVGPLLAPGFALATATAVVLAKWLKRVERDPPRQDYEAYVRLRSNRVDPFRLPGVVQPQARRSDCRDGLDFGRT